MSHGQMGREQLGEESTAHPAQSERRGGVRGEQGSNNSPEHIERIAHEFNNLLTAIMGYANMLSFDAQGGSLSQYAAKSIERSASRAAELTRELMAMAGDDVKMVARVPERPILGTGNILLVDDEELVSSVSADMLRVLGYNVVIASCAAEAIDYYTRFGDEVDLVILDLDMPEMDGGECFRRLKEINPAVRGVLSTGHAVNGNVARAMEAGMVGFVQKPYALAKVSRMVSEALSVET